MRRFGLTAFLAAGSLLAMPSGAVVPSYLLFESGPVRPLAMSPDQTKLFAVDTPDNHLEIFSINGAGVLTRTGTVQVGIEPVAVAARTNDEVWVVNHLSDSVSIVKLTPTPHVERTLLVGDEPQDVVFAGTPDGSGFFPRGFITAAHRGQNHTRGAGHTDSLGQFASAGVGRADVWVFDATSLGTGLGGTPTAVIGLFGDKPRALATNATGTRVYAAVFRSGNQTTTISEGLVCNTSATRITNGTVQPACTNGSSEPGAGGIPLPHKNQSPDSKTRPETGLIVQFNRNGAVSNHWLDEMGRNWDASVRFSLPDRDVFEINAVAATPVAIDGLATCANGAGCWAKVGTTLFNMVWNPTTGKLYVSNTEAKNQTRFEGPGTVASLVKPAGEPPTVQGNLAQSRITVLGGSTPSTVNPQHLNKHLNYAVLKAPAADKAKSLATPTAMAIDGTTLYVAAFGSQKIGVFSTTEIEAGTFTPNASNHITLSGGGPAGLIVRGSRLYVLTRFDDSIAVVDPATKLEVQKIALHTPEPAEVITGRPFLYDAQLTSSNGEASCSSCHIFADMDDLAWDLGNPDDNQVANGNPFNPVVPVGPAPADSLPHVFHPMKGPMTTQSLRGLVFQGPEHWRGDRQSNGSPLDEADSTLAFEAFNVAFDGLVGRASQLSAADMTKFRKFAMALTYPPNPMRQLSNVARTGAEANGAALFSGRVTDVVTACNGCHTLSAANAFFGSNGQTTFEGETQHMKVPHLRNQYQKVGMFGVANPGTFDGPFTSQGNQIRGFGFLHDGSVDTLFRFHSATAFSVTPTEQTELEAFMMVFESDLAPVVGQQVTLTSANPLNVEGARVTELKAQALLDFTSKLLGGVVKECDLVAKVVESGVEHGFLFNPGTSLFLPDNGGAGITDTALRNKALIDGNPVTYTCTPPGSGQRMALDRDEDLLLDGVETNTGVYLDPQHTGSNPALADTDGDSFNDGVEVAAGFNPNDPNSFPGMFVPPPVPSLGPFGLGAVAGLMALVAGARLRRERRR